MLYSTLWAVIGLAIVLLSIYDFYVTTVTISGSGPLSRRLSRALWRLFLWIRHSTGSPLLLKAGGPLLLLVLILFWFGASWLGWFLVFCGSEEAVINAATNADATVYERMHYAGYTLTTIGYGNFRAPSPIGQFGSVIAGLNGLILVTLAITYTLPVVSAAADKRKLALKINALGDGTTAILNAGFGQGDFGVLASQLNDINEAITSLSEKHLAYPILHYFHDEDPSVSLSLNLVRLDEAITVVLAAFPGLSIETRSQLVLSQRLIDRFLDVVVHSFSTGQIGDVPPAPNLATSTALSHADKSPEDIKNHMMSLSRRKKLLSYVRDDGWQWKDVNKGV